MTTTCRGVLLSALALFALLLPPSAWAQNLLPHVHAGDLEALKAELPSGANADPETLARPLYFAAQNGHEDIAAYLLEQGASPDSAINLGSALQIAARGNHLGVLTRLLDAGANPNLKAGEDEKTPLHDAAERGRIEAADLLLERGADIGARTRNDHPPIHLAAKKNRTEMVAFLNRKGAAPRPVGDIAPGALDSANMEAGRIAAEICRGCHAVVPGETGQGRYPAPNLAGVVGRPKGGLPDFPYSDALKAMTGEWTPDEINRFIADPTGVAPGTVMGHAGLQDQAERIAIIAYLTTLSAN